MGNSDPDTTMELTVPVETVQALINLAHDLQGKSGTTLFDDEKSDPDDAEIDILEDRGSDPAGLEFRTLIEDLSEDAQADLVALMWLGRDEGDWAELRSMAEVRRETPTAAYLGATPLVADYLAAGLAAFESGARDVEGHPV